MAPLYQAIRVEKVEDVGEYAVYRGAIDADWTVAAVPNGGYVLAQILEACIHYQGATSHPDPIHVTAHFLSSSVIAACQVRVKPIKNGKGFTNLFAELVQDDQVRISSHLIFGRLLPHPDDPTPRMTLAAPSPYARRVPLHQHPATAPIISPGVRPALNFNKHYRATAEPELAAGNVTRATAGGGGIEWGAWLELTDEKERITPSSLALLSDVFLNIPTLLPPWECPGGAQGWYPTMVMTLEFKFPLPAGSSARTVGIFSSGTFINDPRGRHDTYVEVWSAPSEVGVGEGAVREGWRDEQVCLAVATQMALTVSAEVNTRRARM